MLIVGAKGFAKEVLEVIWQNEQNEAIAFFDNVSPNIEDKLFGRFRVLRTFEQVSAFFSETGDPRVALGIGGPRARYILYQKFQKLSAQFPSAISPFARIGHFDATIGEACNIMTGVVITNSIQIGKGVLLNLNCTIGHDTVIGDFVEMSPGTAVSGRCHIGRFSVLGTNSIVIPDVTIGENVVVGAGAVVTKDVPPNSLVVGMPAVIKKELPPLDF